MSRLDAGSNEDMYGMFGMGETTTGADYEVVEQVKQNTLRYYGQVMRMNEYNFVKKKCMRARIYGGDVKGQVRDGMC